MYLRKIFNPFILKLILFIVFTTSSSVLISETQLSHSLNKGISIYDGDYQKHGQLYNWMWGKHYRELYYMPIHAQTLNLQTWSGGMSYVQSMPNLYGLLFRDRQRNYFLFKILGTPTSFVESSFFKNIYNPHLYKDTYLGNFIKEAITIENPFGFIVSDNLAEKIGLNTGKIRLFEVQDTKVDDIPINQKLASIYHLPDLDSTQIITQIDTLLNDVYTKNRNVEQDLYIRTRLYDMLIGDWNKIPENWGWISSRDSTNISYTPMVLDRSQAFTKVDGVLFKRLLGMLGLNFITNFEAKEPNINKINKLGYTLDVALTSQTTESDWLKQANYIQTMLTDSLLTQTYHNLPKDLQTDDFRFIIEAIKVRRNMLDKIALKYYNRLQQMPVIVSVNKDILVKNISDKQLEIKMFDKKLGTKTFDKIYESKQTNEIWLYTLGDHNSLKIDKSSKHIPLVIIDPRATNQYNIINEANNVSLYTAKDQADKLKTLSNIRKIFVRDTSLIAYEYNKYKYTKFSLMPIGVYDSDLGVNIGTSMSYTVYGLRRKPFTSQHQLSYNYTSGITYQGIYPIFDTNNSFHLLAFASNTKSFINYFGMGNETNSFNGKSKRYNRVHFDNYFITPSYDINIDSNQEINLATSFQLFKIKNPKDRNRYINTVFGDDNSIFKTKKYIEFSVDYQFNKKFSNFLSNLSINFNPGWIVNLNSMRKNVPYAALKIGVDLNLTDRLSIETMLKGKALFSNSYEFYQAATTDLRGFRQNRFIGKQSFYECTDLRLDMGRLENPLTPTYYGLFAGVDHGRVWYPEETSDKWYASFGGGFWLTVFKKITGKFSYFASNEHEKRFIFELGLSF